MTLNELRYVVALAEAGHFGRAAEACHISQPTLSIAIKKLEEELNIQLFERSRTRVWATATGQLIVEQAVAVLDQAEKLRSLARAAQDPWQEPLKLGAIYTIGPYLFPHLIPQLKQLAPKLPLYIEENFTEVLRRKLCRGELDAIIISLPFTEADVVTQVLHDEPLMAVMPSTHRLASEELITPRQLARENLLLLGEGHCFADQVRELLPHTENTVLGSSLETLKYMVASGLGITVLPLCATTGSQQSSLACRPIKAKSAKRTIALAWRASFPRHQVLEALNLGLRACQVVSP